MGVVQTNFHHRIMQSEVALADEAECLPPPPLPPATLYTFPVLYPTTVVFTEPPLINDQQQQQEQQESGCWQEPHLS